MQLCWFPVRVAFSCVLGESWCLGMRINLFFFFQSTFS